MRAGATSRKPVLAQPLFAPLYVNVRGASTAHPAHMSRSSSGACMRRRADRLCREKAASWRGRSGYAAANVPWRQAQHAGPQPGRAAAAAEQGTGAAPAGAAAPSLDPRHTAWQGPQEGLSATPEVWRDAAVAEQPHATTGLHDERVGAGGRGSTGAGVPRARDMTLGQLHELIEEVFASKARADQRRAPLLNLLSTHAESICTCKDLPLF